MIRRRDLLAGVGAAAILSRCKERPRADLGGDAGGSSWPDKSPLLTLHTERPPNLEMPLDALRHDLTPNELMFVRWHLAGLPRTVDLRTYRLAIGGEVDQPLALSLDELRALETTSVVAVNQCSGNSRAVFSPRVPGVQWAGGAIGNARWTGVRLRTLLDRAGIRAGAKCVTFRGLDEPPVAGPPPFVKSLDVDRARDADVIVAWAMNDRPLPMLNGFPVRLVVPGWYSTYWVKALSQMTVLAAPFDGFWMSKAYRIPRADGADESPDHLTTDTVAISRMNVRSLFVPPRPDQRFHVGVPTALEGVAFDGGSGIARVELSFDGGQSWRDATLDADLGPASFRRWRTSWTPSVPGRAELTVRATSRSGEQQRPTATWNRGGYMRNVYERSTVEVTA